MNEKDKIRNEMLLKRKKIDNKRELSTIIVNKMKNMDIYKEAKVICLYKALSNEVNVDELIIDSLSNKKIVLLPKVYEDKLIFIRINENTIYEKSCFNVLEPMFNKNLVYDKKIDLVIVPGLCFDKKMNRIGYGKGYYDAFLIDKAVCKVGVCFSHQILDSIPINDYDIKMELIINEKNILKNEL